MELHLAHLDIAVDAAGDHGRVRDLFHRINTQMVERTLSGEQIGQRLQLVLLFP